MKLLKCLIEKIIHSSFDFHFHLVNIVSKHSNIPLQNSQSWEITQHTIDVQNQQFFRFNRWWTYMQMHWTAFDQYS
jgi:hypothetical protein